MTTPRRKFTSEERLSILQGGERVKAEVCKSKLQDLILDGTMLPQDHNDLKGKVDKDLVLFKSKLNGLLDQPSPYKT